MARRAKRIYPLPEAVRTERSAATQPERWDIRDAREVGGQPCASAEAGRMYVPLDDSAVSVAIRAHEVGHVRWSPGRVPRELPPDVVQAVEDARINLRLGQSGIDLSAGLHDAAKLEADAAALAATVTTDPTAYRRLVLQGVAVHHTGSAEAFLAGLQQAGGITAPDAEARNALIRDAWRQAVRAAEALTSERREPKFEDTRRVAAWLAEILKSAEDAKRDEAEAKRRKVAPGEAEDGEAEARQAVRGAATEDADREEDQVRRGGVIPAPRNGKAGWGTMTVHKPPLTQRLPPRWASRKGRPAEEGCAPKKIGRWCEDMHVFTARKRGRSGTVLLDLSGSMALSPAQVLGMLDAAPAALIATYSGTGGKGILRIIANRGRRAADKWVARNQGGNEVDGPALRWLARQKGPRLWVSDAEVCADGADTAFLVQDAMRVKRAAGIVRTPTPETAATVLRAHGRGGL